MTAGCRCHVIQRMVRAAQSPVTCPAHGPVSQSEARRTVTLRTEQARRMRAAGKTFREIGAKLRITPARARRLANRDVA